MIELSYRTFGPVPATKPEPSLLHSSDPTIPPPLVFYTDDFFGSVWDFRDIFAFLRDHFLPRVEWARPLVSFRELRLFACSIKTLGVTHVLGGLVRILKNVLLRSCSGQCHQINYQATTTTHCFLPDVTTIMQTEQ